jgi:mono/diheme cytochrome c family protein
VSFQRNRRKPYAYAGLTALAMTLSLAACGGGSDTSAESAASAESADGKAQIASARKSTTTTTTATTSTATLVAQPSNTEGRLLASNCFQCHGTLGTGGFDSIRGSEASEVLEFMTKTANRDIMAAHAQGYTPEQLKKIIAYLQQ